MTPYDLKGLLKRLGGSQSDHWNKVLIDQNRSHTRASTSAMEGHESAAIVQPFAGLIGIGPQRA
jgi:hypothetical protein